MRYVVIRDDDTNAFTPVECLERLYGPFLERRLPVNLATIPEVAVNATRADGHREGFLDWGPDSCQGSRPISANPELVNYLRSHDAFHIVQHGLHHHCREFDIASPEAVSAMLNRGTERLLEAGFTRPMAFVAPHDKLSRSSFLEVSRRFAVVSTGWFEWRRLPYLWWPAYARAKFAAASHWHVGKTLLLSHPGCLLSRERDRSTMLDRVKSEVASRKLTVLVTHWWEYFVETRPDQEFIDVLHRVADYLADSSELKVVGFGELASSNVVLN